MSFLDEHQSYMSVVCGGYRARIHTRDLCELDFARRLLAMHGVMGMGLTSSSGARLCVRLREIHTRIWGRRRIKEKPKVDSPCDIEGDHISAHRHRKAITSRYALLVVPILTAISYPSRIEQSLRCTPYTDYISLLIPLSIWRPPSRPHTS